MKSNDCALCWPGLRSILLLTLFVLASGVWTGCSRLPPRIHPPSVDHKKTTEWAFTLCDQDNDGGISEEEAISLPAIKHRFSLYDADSDGKVIPEEFKKRLTSMFDPRAALVGANCYVSLGGRPLSGATVRFVPEEIMADVIPPAEGISDENGLVELSMAMEDLPANAPKIKGILRPGLYRVIITHPTREIPSKYNQETTLGEEVSRWTIMTGAFRFSLDKS